MAQSRQKSYVDKRRRLLEFLVGNHVFLRVTPITRIGRSIRAKKLTPQFVGPFEILERIGPVAYRIALPLQLSTDELQTYIDLSGHCDWSTGVPDCTKYASQIAYCQSKSVKIFLSLGGASGQYGFSSAEDAKEFAYHLWTYYLSGQSSGLLGLIALDGIDFDIEGGTNLYWDVLLQDLYTYSQQKKIYLSAAPQCPIPDYYLNTSISTGLFDYIWVQFYNNPPCEYTDDGDTQKLINSWNQWTADFTATKFYVGLPASPAANGSAGGYVPINVLNNEILPVVETSPKFGGVMLWSRYYDYISGYSDQIVCTTSGAFNVVRSPLVAMVKSASEVLDRLLSHL
ncbi:acidic endochitinase-like [Prosopis cineraria]|uniref:acidic endochitinase-like n=1 Tax=Prosopis cineraria TaxID=364024 RepID=UPI00240FF3DA|nr:acidic endochitinase-like [Prosopis cineraria]